MNRLDRIIPFLLLGIVVSHLGLAATWLLQDATPPYWDEAWYLYQGAVQYDALRAGNLAAWKDAWLDLDTTRPSLVPALTVPFFALLRISDDAGLLVNLVALAILLLATYALGTAVGTRRSGLLAALLIGGYPVLIGLSHILLVEMVMVACVALALFALWRSAGFSRTGWAVAAGVIVGLGLLTKVFYPVFVAGPLAITLWHAVRQVRVERNYRPVLNALLCGLCAAALAATWYPRNLDWMIERSVEVSVGNTATLYGTMTPLSLAGQANYLLSFISEGISFAGFVALLAAIGGLVRRRSPSNRLGSGAPALGSGVLFLAISILPGYLVFATLNNQDLKHVTGILPALAVLSGWGLSRCAGRRWPLATAALLAITLFQAVIGSLPGPWPDWSVAVPALNSRLVLLYASQPHVQETRYARPDPTVWPLEEILDYAQQITDLQSVPRDRVTVGVLPDYPGLEEFALRFEVARRGLPLEVTTALPNNLANQDVLIHKTGDPGLSISWPRIEEVLAQLGRPDSKFELMPRTFPLPDGSKALVYRRQPFPAPGTPFSPQHPVEVEFEGVARFLGYDVQVQVRPAGERWITMTCFWQSLAPPPRTDLNVFVHLIDPVSGDLVTRDDHPFLFKFDPADPVQRDRILFDCRSVPIPPDFAGQALTLRLGIYYPGGRVPVTAGPDSGTDYADVGSIPLAPSP